MDGGVMVFLAAVLIVGVLVLVAIGLTNKRGHKLNREDYQTRFLAIENKLDRTNPATFMNTIIEGDKLLDRAMGEAGISGKTMGERLKKSGSRFSDINAVWRAHKLRNTLAHEAGVEVTYDQALAALGAFKRALRDLGAV